jgi:hypothetical protein
MEIIRDSQAESKSSDSATRNRFSHVTEDLSASKNKQHELQKILNKVETALHKAQAELADRDRLLEGREREYA